MSPFTASLLTLPLELRREIYSYFLPTTTTFYVRNPLAPYASSNKSVIWRRGSTALLRTSRALHNDCIEYIYGSNTFVLTVSYDRVTFKFRFLLATGLAPSKDYSFLEHFSARSIARIRNYSITIDHVDSYTGWIKYNCGGSGLSHGIRLRVQKLADALLVVDGIGRLYVRFVNSNLILDDEKRSKVHARDGVDGTLTETTQMVLEPLRSLLGVRDARVTGAVTKEFARGLEEAMMAPRQAFPLRTERRHDVYTRAGGGFRDIQSSVHAVSRHYLR
ncbi:hypothetical protein BJ546DRAFT_962837 [Cryomyces antarcticus]|nr:hypothetical protein LTR04_005991 [Oleoguttula sp. CCFEE 6159]